MKDWKKISERIMKLGRFTDVHQCGFPSEYHQVDLHFRVNEPYIIGYSFYVSYSFGMWKVDYAEKPVELRTDMKHVYGIKTEKEMLKAVDRYLQDLRARVSGKRIRLACTETDDEKENSMTEKVVIVRDINGVKYEIELTSDEKYRAFLAKQREYVYEECSDWLDDSSWAREFVENEKKEKFLDSMTEHYSENIDYEGMDKKSEEAFKESFLDALVETTPFVDVADNHYTVRNMIDYGYTKPGMLPINANAARSLCQQENIRVFALSALCDKEFEVDSAKVIDDYSKVDIMFGVRKEDWEKFKQKDDLPAIL